MKELITLTMEEQRRYQVIKDSLEGKIYAYLTKYHTKCQVLKLRFVNS